ncbi:hypothetical protein IW261DRAFT_127952 [Armillaria novae-zelandiae]|uniref:Uncharacterized protein n=1 Tax=Armillaria novae-zelandiae TaxID=153914 RepID=A0AA39UBE2_9AGAR|nr:hypothetical protein IW261DRAFT_127952 [Armillaria novae-zelandiae]
MSLLRVPRFKPRPHTFVCLSLASGTTTSLLWVIFIEVPANGQHISSWKISASSGIAFDVIVTMAMSGRSLPLYLAMRSIMISCNFSSSKYLPLPITGNEKKQSGYCYPFMAYCQHEPRHDVHSSL